MKIKSVSSLSTPVKDLDKTVEFYEALGFDFKQRDSRHAVGYVNWFSIDFVKNSSASGSGDMLVYLSVDDPDDAYKELASRGLKPREPVNTENKTREFTLDDPDGNHLVFFKKR